MVAAAFARAPRQRQQHAIGAEISRGVVACRRRQKTRLVDAVFIADAGDGLGDLLPAGAMAERAVGTETTNREADIANVMSEADVPNLHRD